MVFRVESEPCYYSVGAGGRLATSVSPESLLEMQNLEPCCRPPESESALDQMSTYLCAHGSFRGATEVVSLQCFERTNLPDSVMKLMENGSSFTCEFLKHSHLILASFTTPTLVKFVMRAHEFGRTGASSYGPYSVGYCGKGCE